MSRKFNLALKTELTTWANIDSWDSAAHLGKNKLFTQNNVLLSLWAKDCIWDPGIVAIKVLRRISPLVSMDVKNYWGSNLDIAAILGKKE